MLCEFTVKLLECLTGPALLAAPLVVSGQACQGGPCVVSQAGRLWSLELERLSPGSHFLGVCGWGTGGTCSRPHARLGRDRASNVVHFGFKLGALSSSLAMGRREQSDRDLRFPRGETEAKADDCF